MKKSVITVIRMSELSEQEHIEFCSERDKFMEYFKEPRGSISYHGITFHQEFDDFEVNPKYRDELICYLNKSYSNIATFKAYMDSHIAIIYPKSIFNIVYDLYGSVYTSNDNFEIYFVIEKITIIQSQYLDLIKLQKMTKRMIIELNEIKNAIQNRECIQLLLSDIKMTKKDHIKQNKNVIIKQHNTIQLNNATISKQQNIIQQNYLIFLGILISLFLSFISLFFIKL